MNYAYDVEVYPNVFTFSCEHIETGERWYYEISERRNDLSELVTFLIALHDNRVNMVGYNNFEYDWLIVNFILERYITWLHLGYEAVTGFIFGMNERIFNADRNEKFGLIIWRPTIRQIDLIQIHALNTIDEKTGQGRWTSLKMLEFNMRNVTVQDLPFKPGTILTVDQIPVLAHYNMEGDVAATVQFFHHTVELIKLRDELTERFGKDFTNYSDVKIGETYFAMRLEEHTPGICYYKDTNGHRQMRQTHRTSMNLRDAVLPWITFDQPEFQRIRDYFISQTITETKGVFKGLECIIDGLHFSFGLGGLHASVDSQSIYSDDDYVIRDVDVKSYYGNLTISNRFYPEHLGEAFCDIFLDMFNERQTHTKKSAMNNTLKLAMNAGGFGKTNSKFSPFYDPLHTMKVTINGQLLICLLIEGFMTIQGLKVIQANTDGVTIRVPRVVSDQVDWICRQWETVTGLELEDVNYKSMFIRDVNNYIGVFEDGKIKQVGVYETKQAHEQTPLGWQKDFSAWIVPKAANAVLVDGVDLIEYVTSPDRDIMDFMCRTKTQSKSKLVMTDLNGVEHEQQRVTRYYVSHVGGSLSTLSPPTIPHVDGTYKKAQKITDVQYFQYNSYVWNPAVHTKNKSMNGTKRTSIQKGWKVTECNDIRFLNASNINHSYYITEARKLIEKLL